MSESVVRYATRQAAALALAVGLSLGLGWVSRSQGGLGQQAPDIIGVAHVIDGDTLIIGNARIRLEGIDAPESAQMCNSEWLDKWACGADATKYLARLVDGRTVTCRHRGVDMYGRILGACRIGTLDINADMVRQGLAWAFVRYSTSYVSVEAEARSARRGIWQSQTRPAWEYRAQRWTTAEVAAPRGCAIKGNVTRHGRIYHMPWSPWYHKVHMDGPDKRWFCSEAEALAAGWRPAVVR
jgi:endonuclease YncB( thermonuclease family)